MLQSYANTEFTLPSFNQANLQKNENTVYNWKDNYCIVYGMSIKILFLIYIVKFVLNKKLLVTLIIK